MSKRRARPRSILRSDKVKIGYTITPGPTTVFGDTEIRGLDRVDRSLIERELAYRER